MKSLPRGAYTRGGGLRLCLPQMLQRPALALEEKVMMTAVIGVEQFPQDKSRVGHFGYCPPRHSPQENVKVRRKHQCVLLITASFRASACLIHWPVLFLFWVGVGQFELCILFILTCVVDM